MSATQTARTQASATQTPPNQTKRTTPMTQQTVENTRAACENLFTASADTFRTAMDMGFKFQQDAMKTMSEFFSYGDTFKDVREQFETVTTDSINLVRKNAEQTQKFVDDGCRNGVELVRKSFELVEGKDKDVFGRSQDMMKSSFDMARHNVEMVAKTSAAAIENWSDFIGKTMPVATTKKAAK